MRFAVLTASYWLPIFAYPTKSSVDILTYMKKSAKEEFAERLVNAMLRAGHVAKRGAKSGADAMELQKVAKVSYEMARRYLAGSALPDENKISVIADWLRVRRPWLRDGDLPMLRVSDERMANDAGIVAHFEFVYTNTTDSGREFLENALRSAEQHFGIR